MHIKKLEICGFKSFVDRTVIHFDHDMIGVVGPNGCGKSNVVDAIRWVIGEQSAKALRGKSMGDVIFNGSESRTYAGFAEVTITFDNGDSAMAQQLPLEYRDYSELAVTRRLYRGDGANDYFINKTPVRLRDVTDVFLGTGVGRKAYSIVEQGKIGLIVSARPEDRRVLIEEAAGITKYKARKRQAESKMDLTRVNLTRVGDIVSEIERQIGSLRRQAAKAERYVRYRQELDDLVLWDASHKLLELVARIGVAARAKEDLDELARAERASVDARDAEIEVMRQHAHSAEQAAERAQSTAFVSDNHVRETETRIERSHDRYEHLGSRLAEAHDEQKGLEDKARSLATEKGQLEVQLTTIEQDQQAVVARVDHETAGLEQLAADVAVRSERAHDMRREEADASAAIARAEAELDGFERRRHDTEQRQRRLAEELARLQGEEAGIELRRRELEASVEHLVHRKHSLSDARDALNRELPLLRDELVHRECLLDDERARLHRDRSRLEALFEVAERLEGVGAGVRNLLKTGDAALGGIVADRIDVPANYTAALAGLVGDRLQCVVVDDLDRALDLLRGLAHERQGRATVIPRSVRDTGRPHRGMSLANDGVVGLLIDQVRFAPEDEGVVRALVGDALLVESAAVARRLHQHGLGSDVVTLDGTVFHHDGRVTGGAEDGLATGILEQKRVIRELGEAVSLLERAVGDAASICEQVVSHVAELDQALDEAKSEAHAAEIAMVTGRQDLARLAQQLELVSRRRIEVAGELAELDSAIEKADADHERSLATLSAARQRRAELSAALVGVDDELLSMRERLAAQQAVVTERRVALASTRERAYACRTALERVSRDHGELDARIVGLEVDRERAALEAGQTAAEIVLAREDLTRAKHEARTSHAAFSSARLGLDDARHSLGVSEAELRSMRSKLDEVSGRLQTETMELQRLELAHEHLIDGVRERFRGLELRRVVGDYHTRPQVTDEQRQRVRDLGDLIDRMGSVNVDAMQEYEQASERFEYYTRQRDDLEAALADLEKAISQMNRESRRLFKHAFEGISRRFKEIFPMMFRGGKAELKLTDPSDLLETGIDILAQPPGKRLGNIELMSGGEKAFTAVSLLLAIFRFKPSPFCILDEVDAPLDDANIDRYVQAIRAMTDRSQFILITHSKRTMQAVDVLYGVTMQEPGVSKLVGVRVGEAAHRSTTRKATSRPPDTLSTNAGSTDEGEPAPFDGAGPTLLDASGPKGPEVPARDELAEAFAEIADDEDDAAVA